MSNFNEQFIFQAKEILKLITSTGQEAYIVGESLRDLVLNQKIREVEIFTSLGKENLVNLFNEEQIIEILDNAVRIHHLGLNYTISLSSHYVFNPKVKVKTPRRHYSTSLMDFLETKIYSVNTLAMANNNVIYDCFNGRQDIFRKRIRMICDNPASVFLSDPIKMLEAIRLVSELGFRLDKSVFKAIKKKNKCLLKVDLTLVTKEMIRIISGKYAKKAIKLLVKSKLYKRMPLYKFEIKRLYNHYKKIDAQTFVAASLIKNKGYNQLVGRAFADASLLEHIVELGMNWPKSNYDVTTLFNNHLECLLKANIVNYNLGRAKNKQKQITKLYNRLVIKSIEELEIKSKDIHVIANNLTDLEIEDILRDISNKVLHKKLKNEYETLRNYVINTFLTKEEIKKEEKQEEIKEVVQESLFTDDDFVNNENNNLEENVNKQEEQDLKDTSNIIHQEFDSASAEFELLRRQQIELDRRVSELEFQHLEKELDDEIEKKIKQSGLLDGLVGSYRESTYNTLKKVYYDVLIKTEKYQRLERKGESYGQD